MCAHGSGGWGLSQATGSSSSGRVRFVAANDFEGQRLELRIGTHSGLAVAGTIHTHKFSYGMWADTVNTASRTESEGIPGQIQITPATHDLLIGKAYTFEPRGAIQVEGKGTMAAWL